MVRTRERERERAIEARAGAIARESPKRSRWGRWGRDASATVGVSSTDARTGGQVTEQKPHCDWEGFTDGKYKNAWNGCDWGGCDEWF